MCKTLVFEILQETTGHKPNLCKIARLIKKLRVSATARHTTEINELKIGVIVY